jgi:hypothetical protein
LIAVLTTFFIIVVNKVILYSGNTKYLLEHLIKKYKNIDFKNDKKFIYFKAINDLATYCITNNDLSVNELLNGFYNEEFENILKKIDAKNEKDNDTIKKLKNDYLWEFFVFLRRNIRITKNKSGEFLSIEKFPLHTYWVKGNENKFLNSSVHEFIHLSYWFIILEIIDNQELVKIPTCPV